MTREKEYISIFTQFADQIHSTLMSFAHYSDYYYAIELGKQFRKICKIIGKDPRFTGMNKLLNLVREKDRTYIDYLRKFVKKYEDHPKLSESPHPKEDKFKSLIEQFYFKVDQINPLAEKTKATNSQILSKKQREKKLFHQSKKWLKEQMNLFFTPEQEDLILNYRKNITPQQKQLIRYVIPPKEEVKILKKYCEFMIEEFVKLETKGWYNSIKNSYRKWLDYLQKVADLRAEPEYEKFRETLRKYYRNFEDWIGRVDIKYGGHPDLTLDEVEIMNPEMSDKISLYKYIRRAYIRYKEGQTILKQFKQ